MSLHWLTEEEMETLGANGLDDGPGNAVICYLNNWYFWDVSWTKLYGPYQLRQDAINALLDYSNTTGLG
jgi:hypothetical protein